jgi:hypothetical protein
MAQFCNQHGEPFAGFMNAEVCFNNMGDIA